MYCRNFSKSNRVHYVNQKKSDIGAVRGHSHTQEGFWTDPTLWEEMFPKAQGNWACMDPCTRCRKTELCHHVQGQVIQFFRHIYLYIPSRYINFDFVLSARRDMRNKFAFKTVTLKWYSHDKFHYMCCYASRFKSPVGRLLSDPEHFFSRH